MITYGDFRYVAGVWNQRLGINRFQLAEFPEHPALPLPKIIKQLKSRHLS